MVPSALHSGNRAVRSQAFMGNPERFARGGEVVRSWGGAVVGWCGRGKLGLPPPHHPTTSPPCYFIRPAIPSTDAENAPGAIGRAAPGVFGSIMPGGAAGDRTAG